MAPFRQVQILAGDMEDDGDLIMELTKELAEARSQVEYEKREKEYWMNKYLKLRQRHTVTIGRERRNSRDEDELIPRRAVQAPQPAPSVDSANQGRTIDLTTPRQHPRPSPNSRTFNFDVPTPPSNTGSTRRSNRFSAPPYSSDTTFETSTPSTTRASSHLSRPDSRGRLQDTTSVPLEALARSSFSRTPSLPAFSRAQPRSAAIEGMARQALGLHARNLDRVSPGESATSSGSMNNEGDSHEQASLALAMALHAEEVEQARARQARMAEEAQRLHEAELEHLSRQSGHTDHASALNVLRQAMANANSIHGRPLGFDMHGGMFLNPDTMSHDELVQLGERMGDVKKDRWRQRAMEVMSRLPNHRLRRPPTEDSSMCIVCRDDFAVNDHVLTLPCAHMFHYDCVQGWIQDNNSCPTCKLPIEED